MIECGKFLKVPIEEVNKPPKEEGHYFVYRKRWWAVTEDKCLLTYRGASTQCNSNKEFVERLIKSDTHPGVSVELFDIIYWPVDPSDY